MDNKSLSWSTTTFSKKPKNVGWSEDAKLKDGTIVYVLYFNNDTNTMCLDDIREGITYEIPYGGKAKGYVLAFKLNNVYKEINK